MLTAECETEQAKETLRDVPTWLVVVLSAIVGAAVTAGAMAPINMTPDYKRGHQDGFKAGTEAAFPVKNQDFNEGVDHGYQLRKNEHPEN